MDEWQIDEYGKRFRMIGKNIKEYEPTITVDGIEIPQSQLEAFNQMRREVAEKERAAASEKAPPRLCPYKSGIAAECKETCAWYTNSGCRRIYSASGEPTKEAKGKNCPLSGRVCYGELCGVWRNGCTATTV